MIFGKKNSFKTVFDSGFKAKYIHFWVFFTLISWSLVSRILFSCMKPMNKSCFLYSFNRYTVCAICWNHNNYFFNSILLQIHKRLRCGHFEKQWFRVIITYVSVIISTKSLHLARKYVQKYFFVLFLVLISLLFSMSLGKTFHQQTKRHFTLYNSSKLTTVPSLCAHTHT